MKIKFSVVFITAVMTANAAQAVEIYHKNNNKVNLYGKVVGLYYFSDTRANSDRSYVRLGFRGETQITSQLTGFGRWEAQFNTNTTESQNTVRTRLGFAGLRFAHLGSLDFGRNLGVTYDVAAWSDKLAEFSAGTYGSDNFMQKRISSALTYRNKNFFGLVNGLNFALQLQGKNDQAANVLSQNGTGYGISVIYNIGSTGLSVGGALSSSGRTAAQNAATILGHGDRADIYTVGIKYEANKIYLAAHYKQTYNATRFGNIRRRAHGFANKADNFEVMARYTFDSGFTPAVGYLQSKGYDIGRYGREDLVKYFNIGATYNFNKNMYVYIVYKINLLKENKFIRDSRTATDNIVALALAYRF